MATGLAKGLNGKRAAFGDGRKIIWGPWSKEIFQGNPQIARPGDEGKSNIQWIDFYKGHRQYNKMNAKRTHWVWNYDFKATPGRFFLSFDEIEFAENCGHGFAVIEPNVPWHKTVAPNKDWGKPRYQAVADRLRADGWDVVQFSHGRDRLRNVRVVTTPTFRHAAAALSRAALAILPEGGLHHAAAALHIPAVVIFGGFIPPAVTGYAMHNNLTGGAEACGSLSRCQHCRDALDNISVDEVCSALAG